MINDSIMEIRNIQIYDNVYDMAQEYWDKFDTLTENEKHYLMHLNDYQEWKYCLIDESIVIIYSGVDGLVICKTDLDGFFSANLDDYDEDDYE